MMAGFLKKTFRPMQAIPKPVSVMFALTGLITMLMIWNWMGTNFADQGKSILLPTPKATLERLTDNFGYGPETQKSIDRALEKIDPSDSEQREATVSKARSRSRKHLETLWSDLRVSFFRVSTAFLLAAFLGVPLGIFMGAFRRVESYFQAMVEFIRYVPVPALVPLLIILFGVDEAPKIMLIFLGTFFQLILMVSDEVKRVPKEMLRACYCMGGTTMEVVSQVIMKQAMPGIFDALRLCNGWAWTWLIVAEMVAASEGMGFRIIRLQRYLKTDHIFIYLIVLGLVGLALDAVFRLINRRLFAWSLHNKG